MTAQQEEGATDARERLIEEFGHVMQEFQRSADTLDQRVADKLGLNRTDLRCLELLFSPTPLSPGELAAKAGLTTGGVTTAIDRLERSGYAARVRDTADRRRVTVEPTEKGYAMVAEIFAPIAQEGADYLRTLDVATLAQMTEFLRFATNQQYEHATQLAQET
ncbi:MarR family winged helix-turn-helix transcriptional regulator [Kitasatospora kifunensis]|uniref:DNA-binding MarR family transcriptional regulator n=1 Tax=Kitasatospora kifunensis TaxID=58351 RepID=A0A7W7R489_KITKI|nr:MarR family transcriptional regulator [Kitasatospora kifunensis]MBB4924904.1 DNA-binding MarR family transcriptional regulator [Kitasatospora kifunensis]